MPQLSRVGLLASTGLTSGSVRPAFEFNAAFGVIPAGATFSRASGATGIDYRGYLREFSASEPRFVYDPALTYNPAVNPWFDGVVPGVFGSGGQGPNGCSWFYAPDITGLVQEIVSVFVEDGLTVVRVRRHSNGVPVGGTGISVSDFMSDNQQTPLEPFSITSSMFLRVVGPTQGYTGSNWHFDTYTHNAAYIGGDYPAMVAPPSGNTPIRQAVFTRTSNPQPAGAAFIQWRISHQFPANSIVDFTVDYAFPTLAFGSQPLTATIPLDVLNERVGTTPQYGLQGLLIEDGNGYNAVANPRLEGAVAGSPGTAPTLGFISGSGSGLTRSIRVGFEGGHRFVDFRWTGTATSSNQIIIGFNGSGALPCAAGETLSGAVDLSLFGPALPANPDVRIVENGAATYTATLAPVVGTAQPQPLRRNRVPVVRAITDAGTTNADFLFVCAFASGVFYDFTVRIALPCLEKAARPTSVALPPVGTPGAATRMRDDFTLPGGFNGGTLSFAARFAFFGLGTTSPSSSGDILLLSPTGSSADCVRITHSARVPTIGKRVSVSTTASFARSAAMNYDQFSTGCASFDGVSAVGSWDGSAVSVDTSPGAALATMNVNRLGRGVALVAPGIIVRFLRIWSGRKLSPTQVRREASRTE
jgi:hypothetical protein